VENNLKKQKPKLLVAYCSHEAAVFAVMNYHYSKTMPSGKLIKFGIWENDIFIGSIIYGRGANNNLSKMLDYKNNQVCELVRVALGKHLSQVTHLIAITIKMLKKTNRDLEVIFSYADRDQGHEGTIYKAGNWKVLGGLVKDQSLYINGKVSHPRSLVSKYGSRSIKFLTEKVDKNAKYIATKGKIRYVYALSKEAAMRIKHKE